MIYLTNVNKRYGAKILFDNISFHLREGEKVGLVGDNGIGKTTFFRMILGTESVDSGTVTLRKGACAAMIAQDLESSSETVLERAVTGNPCFRDAKKILQGLIENQIFHKQDPERWSLEYGKAQEEFEQLGGYGYEAKAQSILGGLGFCDAQLQQPVESFSGGWRMRVELSRLLLQSPDVLLLDEPSNHLDLQSVIWLEGFLKSYDNAFILISHDRQFLNSLVDRIVHLDGGDLKSYKGNYDDFERQKHEREVHLEKEAANQRRHINEVECFVERFRAKNTKATQVQSRLKMLGKMERVETIKKRKSIKFWFPQPTRFGKTAIELVRVCKQYKNNMVYPELSLRLERGSKVALVGSNGAGKSTLLKILAGIVTVDGGEILLGSNVTRSYYAQHQSETLNDSLTILETISEIAGSMSQTQQQNILGAFRFSQEEVQKKVGTLSGGERARLALAKMLVSPASVLLLDEPTNHLDIKSRDALAMALVEFKGCIVVVSHDRFFLDSFINRIWEVERGTVQEVFGGYKDYERLQKQKEEIFRIPKKQQSFGENNKSKKRLEAEDRNRRYRERKLLDEKLKTLEIRLELVIVEKEQLDQKLAKEEIYQVEKKEDLMQVLSRRKELVVLENHLFDQIEALTEQLEII